ncbi:trichothecene biosynthesis enzyme [Sporothrix schenckii 1099-18]|uniref:Trichothecene biosynthesis enzyme n=2 Tax=Sporothrix schenckii TaxID=29908 RepID=U7Q1U6_SPOS1|nr:trichothecene biosynthesis enzyme [Sporothrix schenckii 1099-18]ERT01157.1 hypothetical protein HMPREF1624_02398 [Sporothrix schenckii ATCC 58251]KJR88293.1 trichothecene biosynthesis enzyme [Sporothrix schenckii 1099-18]
MRLFTTGVASLEIFSLWVAALAAATPVPDTWSSSLAKRHHRGRLDNCPDVHGGSFIINQYQLYPENADWDGDSCLVYFGSLWNATVAIYDPYIDDFITILEFANVSHTGTEHIGGVAWDRFTGLVTILVGSAAPWATAGANVSGTDMVLKWDPKTQTTLWTVNLTTTTQGLYGAFQDIETDKRGYTYVVGTYPGSILRINADGTEVIPWYGPLQTANTTIPGLGGLVALGPEGNLLLANDAGNGSIYRLDTRDALAPRTLTEVPIVPDIRFKDTDAIYAPPMYNGTVLLVSSHAAGIQVLVSPDASWTTARHVGTIPNPPKDTAADVTNATIGSVVTAAVQIGPNAVYMIDEWLFDPWVPGEVAGNRTEFPMPDITAQIKTLLRLRECL